MNKYGIFGFYHCNCGSIQVIQTDNPDETIVCEGCNEDLYAYRTATEKEVIKYFKGVLK